MTFLFYSTLIFMTAALGGILPLFISSANEKLLKTWVSLGAGILLGMVFLHMVPESSRRNPDSFGFWFLGGFLILLVLERFVMVHACEEGGCDYHTVGIAAFLGLTIHGLIEGMALTSSFFITGMAPLVLVAIVSHKAPTAFALSSILKLAGKSHVHIILYTFGVALSVPSGALFAYAMIQTNQMSELAGVFLAVSSGTFMYISACDLLPELHRSQDERFKRLFYFLIGIVLSFVSGKFAGE